MRRWWRRGFRQSSFNAVYGVFLLGPAWILTRAFFGMFSRAAVEQAFWATDEFRFFSVGAFGWTACFLCGIWWKGEPWPLRVYVFGHELTHAIWVWLWGGKVYDRQWWSPDGGFIVTDTHNFWIALAPYFYPLYSLVVVVLYGAASLFYHLTGAPATLLAMTLEQWLFLALGATWSFHFSFTIWMIPKGQTDLRSHGEFFSLVIIYLMNVALLSLFLIIADPQLTFAAFAHELQRNAEDLSEFILNAVRQVSAAI